MHRFVGDKRSLVLANTRNLNARTSFLGLTIRDRLIREIVTTIAENGTEGTMVGRTRGETTTGRTMKVHPACLPKETSRSVVGRLPIAVQHSMKYDPSIQTC